MKKRQKASTSSSTEKKRTAPKTNSLEGRTPPPTECGRSSSNRTPGRGGLQAEKLEKALKEVKTKRGDTSGKRTVAVAVASTTTANQSSSQHSSLTASANSTPARGSDSTSNSELSKTLNTKNKKSAIIRKLKRERIKSNRSSEQASASPQQPEDDLEADDLRTPPIRDERSREKIEPERHGSLVTIQETMCRLLHEFAAKCNNLTLEQLQKQFQELPDASKDECRIYLDPRNSAKNRYCNIYCLDRSRVVLNFMREMGGGTYIHANKVQYPSLKNPFIITQGPLPKTVHDFWRMVWQEKTENIVMLCNMRENGKQKSAEYFCQQLGERVNFGQIAVKTCMRDQEDGLVTTRLEVAFNLHETRTVMHYHMVDWRDCRAPVVCVRQLFHLLKKIRCGSTPAVVHCSAGVGRSGTLVALEMCLMDVAHGQAVDVQKVVHQLRRHRCHAVQTFEQYLAIHKFVLQFGEQNECITMNEISNFYRLFQEYSSSLD